MRGGFCFAKITNSELLKLFLKWGVVINIPREYDPLTGKRRLRSRAWQWLVGLFTAFADKPSGAFVVLLLIVTVVITPNYPAVGLSLGLVSLMLIVFLVNKKVRGEKERDKLLVKQRRYKRHENTLTGDDPYGLFDEQKNPPKNKKGHGSWDDNPNQAPPLKK